MIDARRMEVFTALFDNNLNTIQLPQALVLEPTYFDAMMKEKPIIFSGNGMKKFINLLPLSSNLLFNNSDVSVSALVKISLKKFQQNEFAELSNAEPTYIKQFYTI